MFNIRCTGAHIVCHNYDDETIVINGVPHKVRLDYALINGEWIARDNYNSLFIHRTDKYSENVSVSARKKARLLCDKAVAEWVKSHPTEITEAQEKYRDDFNNRIEASIVTLDKEIERLESLRHDAEDLTVEQLSERSVETYVRINR